MLFEQDSACMMQSPTHQRLECCCLSFPGPASHSTSSATAHSAARTVSGRYNAADVHATSRHGLAPEIRVCSLLYCPLIYRTNDGKRCRVELPAQKQQHSSRKILLTLQARPPFSPHFSFNVLQCSPLDICRQSKQTETPDSCMQGCTRMQRCRD
jgi:hypothetical protein